jgi:hypothetical protein
MKKIAVLAVMLLLLVASGCNTSSQADVNRAMQDFNNTAVHLGRPSWSLFGDHAEILYVCRNFGKSY